MAPTRLARGKRTGSAAGISASTGAERFHQSASVIPLRRAARVASTEPRAAPHDQSVEQADDRVELDVVEVESVHRGQFALVFGEGVRAQRRAADADLQQPRMPVVEPPQVLGDRGEPGPPSVRQFAGEFAVRVVEHQLQQFVAAGHVGVERHRRDAQFVGDPAHGDRVQPFRVRDPDPGEHHVLDRELRFRAAARGTGHAPQQLDGPPRIARFLSLHFAPRTQYRVFR